MLGWDGGSKIVGHDLLIIPKQKKPDVKVYPDFNEEQQHSLHIIKIVQKTGIKVVKFQKYFLSFTQ